MTERESTKINKFPMNFPESSKYIRENELLPCPFCGKQPTVVPYFIKGVANHINHFAECSCGIRTRSRKGYEGAIEDWNTRPIESALEAQVADMHSRLKEVVGEIEKLPANILAEVWIKDESIKILRSAFPEVLK